MVEDILRQCRYIWFGGSSLNGTGGGEEEGVRAFWGYCKGRESV